MASTESATAWLEAAGRHPLLTAAEELHCGALVRAWQDHPAGPEQAPPAVKRRGLRARDRLICGNLRMVGHVAQRAQHGSGKALALEDALQVGAIGLQRAAEKFDPARGYKFSTYAFWWIRQAISREAEVSSRTIRLPSGFASRVGRLESVREQLACELGRMPSTGEIAAALDIPVHELLELSRRGQGCLSLDVHYGDDNGHSLADIVAAPSAPDDPQRAELLARIHNLEPDLARLVKMRWGIGQPARNSKELAALHGVTSHRIHQRLRQAEALLRHNVNCRAAARPVDPGPIPGAAQAVVQPELPWPPTPSPGPGPGAADGRT
jgi:RNA polymerase primary sigma factor